MDAGREVIPAPNRDGSLDTALSGHNRGVADRLDSPFHLLGLSDEFRKVVPLKRGKEASCSGFAAAMGRPLSRW
jgi:hypothetical protein